MPKSMYYKHCHSPNILPIEVVHIFRGNMLRGRRILGIYAIVEWLSTLIFCASNLKCLTPPRNTECIIIF